MSGGSERWLEALDMIEGLHPSAVVSGHKRDGDADSPDDIGRTRRYVEDFSAALRRAANHQELYDSILALYPDRMNRGALWNSVKAVFV